MNYKTHDMELVVRDRHIYIYPPNATLHAVEFLHFEDEVVVERSPINMKRKEKETCEQMLLRHGFQYVGQY